MILGINVFGSEVERLVFDLGSSCSFHMWKLMVPLAGFEPTTYGSEDRRSILLSYKGVLRYPIRTSVPAG